MKKMNFLNGLTIVVLGVSLSLTACKKEGCTDPKATNYNKKANDDDGSCNYDGPLIDPLEITVSDNITAPTNWNAGTVKVCGDISISAALTIQPGVNVIMCANASLEVNETGSITAIGTAANKITFKGEVTSPGYWRGIGIRSNNPNNQFDYVTVSDAGSYWLWEYSNVLVGDLAKLSVKNSVFSNSEKYGLYATNNAAFSTFENNTFSNNTLAGLNISVNQVGSIDANSNYNSGNGEAFINVRGGVIGSNEVWPATSTPYLIVGDVTVNAGLTLNPGVSIQMEAEAVIDVMESGYFYAVGSATQPIYIVGRYASAGFWQGMYIRSNNPNNRFNYVTIRDGGSYWFYDYAGVKVAGRLEMDNSTISNSNSWALVIGGSGSIFCSGASQTDAAGVQTVNTLSGNGTGADADCVGGGCTVLFE